jgi:hypothetical protein
MSGRYWELAEAEVQQTLPEVDLPDEPTKPDGENEPATEGGAE